MRLGSVRSVRRAAVLIAAVLLAALVPRSEAARKSYRAESYRVVLRVQPGGSVSVREEVRVRFNGGPFRFFYRGIPLAYVDGIEGIASPDSIRIRRRRERVDVTWNFTPCRDTTRTFVVEYVARGVLYDSGDHRRLRWIAFPANERAYRIDAASAAVIFPPGTPPPASIRTEPAGLAFQEAMQPAGMAEREAAPPSEGRVFELAPVRLNENRTVLLQVDLPPGALAGSEPAWRQLQLLQAERHPAVLAVAGVLLLLGLLWVMQTRSALLASLAPGTVRTRVRRSAVRVSEPPEDVSPALSGAILLGQPALPHAFAVIFDLARRGVLRIDAGPTSSRWVAPRPRVVRGAVTADLGAWERVVMEAVFDRPNADGSGDWRRAGSALGRRFKHYSQAVEIELVRRGELDPAGLEARRAMKRRLLLLLVPDALAFVAGILLLDALGPAAFIPVGAVAMVMVAAVVVMATIPVRTRSGADVAQLWMGFARYLKEASKGSTPVDATRFADWLPHALALGVAGPWASGAKRWGTQPPTWFRSGSGDLAGDMRALAAVIAITSSTGGARGGVGGAAGGGSSGAG